MIIRRRHTANFTTISNRLFDDERLQADEVGVLAYLQSRPHNWEVRRPALMRRWGIGAGTMKRMVNNWMRTGWCQATKVRLPNGTFCILYDVFDQPGRELGDDEIREALSLVSSEAVSDDVGPDFAPDEPPPIPDGPPPSQPGVVNQGGGEAGVAYIEGLNTDHQGKDSNQNSEREWARAREKHATNLVLFKQRYPTAASDDQGKIDDAWFALSFEEGEAALSQLPAFLDKLKRDRRSHVPAAWKYLKEKRFELLANATSVATPAGHPADSPEGRAIIALFQIACLDELMHKTVLRLGVVYHRIALTPRLMELAKLPSRDAWVQLSHQQAGAWDQLLREVFPHVTSRQRLRAGSLAPRPWPPLVGGGWPATGPPTVPELTDEDAVDFR